MRTFTLAAILVFAVGTPVFAQSVVEKGRYQAVLGDCAGCHTAPGGKPLAGGTILETPFGKIAAPKVYDPEARCHDDEHGRTVFIVELGYPEGCPPIPSEYDGQLGELEITVEGTPPTAGIMEPVDLAARDVAYVAEGCAMRATFTGSVGTLELEAAASLEGMGYDLLGTGRWTPAGGAGCDLTIGGKYSNYSEVHEHDAEEEEVD